MHGEHQNAGYGAGIVRTPDTWKPSAADRVTATPTQGRGISSRDGAALCNHRIMTERGRRLLDLESHDIDMIMSHPVQMSTVALIADLITQLRGARNSADLYAFQRDLLDVTLEAQGRQAEATRNLRRERHGRGTPSATRGDWAVEQRVWDRVVRQLRTVGDALAWRVFNFDRRFITVLSGNSPVSPMTGKAGLAKEIEEVERRWNCLRQFSLLHDLTSVIRIGDITVLTPDGPRLGEIKTNPANHRAEQTRPPSARLPSCPRAPQS